MNEAFVFSDCFFSWISLNQKIVFGFSYLNIVFELGCPETVNCSSHCIWGI